MGLSYSVRTQIKKMLLAGEKWEDIQKATGVSSATVAKIKKEMLICDSSSERSENKAAEKVKSKGLRKVVENATVEQLKQEVVGMLLYRARAGELEDSDAIRILAATTEKKELGNLAQNLTINILQVVSNARQSAIEKVERVKKGIVEQIIDTTAAASEEAPAFDTPVPEAPQQTEPEKPPKD